MCGIIGIVSKSAVNQMLYDGLTVLQHRGQDAAGIVTAEGRTFHMHKNKGLVRDVFRTRTSPLFLCIWKVRPSAVTMPAASCPRCCSTVKPSYNIWFTALLETMPIMPHIEIPFFSIQKWVLRFYLFGADICGGFSTAGSSWTRALINVICLANDSGKNSFA